MTRSPRATAGRTLLAVGLALLLFPCGAMAQAEDDPFETAKAAFMAAETPQEKVAVSERFLAAHPDHEQVPVVVDAAAGVLLDQMDYREGAVALTRAQLARTTDEPLKQDLRDILLSLYSVPGYGDELRKLVSERYDVATMTYVEHLTVLEAATGAEAWALVDEHAAAAAPQATPEAFGAAYADRGFSEERIATAGNNRQGLLKTFTGWSAANQGDLDRAYADFTAAAALVSPNFFGLPSNDLYRYWGRTLVGNGEGEKGLEMLALADIFAADHDAGELARQTFADLGRNEDKFADYLWQLRQEHAVAMVDFQATDYEGAARSYNELRGEKATLLAFWFPT